MACLHARSCGDISDAYGHRTPLNLQTLPLSYTVAEDRAGADGRGLTTRRKSPRRRLKRVLGLRVLALGFTAFKGSGA